MHETAWRGLRRLLAGVVVLGVLVAGVKCVAHLMRSEEERIAEAVDSARDALVEFEREEFLEFFADEVTYKGKDRRAALERDLDRWIKEIRIGRVTILEKRIDVRGDDATIHLRCDFGTLFQSLRVVDVVLEAVKTPEGWKCTAFDWK